MEIPTTAYPALASVVAALIAGAIAFLTIVLSKEQKTSEFRQNWVDALRSDIADLIGLIQGSAAHVKFVDDLHGMEAAKKFVEEHADDLTKMVTTYYRIRLRLNPKEHKQLLAALDRAVSMYSGKISYKKPDAVAKVVEAVAVESQTVLKSEWRRVKRGEMPFVVTKYLSLIVFLGAIATLYFYMSGHVSISWKT